MYETPLKQNNKVTDDFEALFQPEYKLVCKLSGHNDLDQINHENIVNTVTDEKANDNLELQNLLTLQNQCIKNDDIK